MTQFDQTLKFDRAGAGAVGLSQALGDASADKRLEVLRRVAETGSISQAAREVDISYKAAWQAIDTLTNLAGEPLVDRTVGGSGGGGARLTPQGLQLLALADELQQAREAVLARFAGNPLAAAGLGLQTSMRNQLPCRVESLQADGTGDPTVRVWVRTPGAARLVAQITRESADLLGLAPGLPVLVLCKATAVRIATGTDPTGGEEPGGGAAPTLSGRVERVSAGHSHDEITLALPAGGRWVGFAPHPCAAAVGDGAWAAMAPSSLVLAR
jgi:molybdate transport system regulatory protein